MAPVRVHSGVKSIAEKSLTREMRMVTNFILIYWEWPYHIMWSPTMHALTQCALHEPFLDS